ncbi:hypothetical protein Q5O89_02525 [Peribacillus frigoritolerans]|nr:hypothetical protein [Peribacillus frigoritolerans]
MGSRQYESSHSETFLVNVFTIAQSDAEHFDELADTVSLFANALNHFTHVFTNQLKIIVLIGSNGKGKDLLTESANDLTNTVLSQFTDKRYSRESEMSILRFFN